MSSIFSDTLYRPEKCIDGIFENEEVGDLNICLSELDQPDAWLSVTLPERSVVSEVVVYGRSDCCNVKYLSGYEVWLSDAVGVPGADAYKCGGPIEVSRNSDYHDSVSCGGRRGTVVTMLLPGPSRTIMISELVVNGYTY